MSHSYPQPGTILAERYRVGEVIGRGGMGVVLAAENTITRRRVAIKWLRSDLVDNAEAAERLVREASVASCIRHPNVVDVFDVLRDGTSIFLVMDLLQGESLEAVLHRGGIPLHELVSILVPAMKGVAEAHRQDIVHRDIHPGNIFLSRETHDPRPVPVVLDFGISKFGNVTAGQRALTRSNMCMGTPLYMSYEQLYSARDVDARTDVYSFGVILYEGLTGKPPFDGESLMEVAGKITAGTPVHPKVLRPEIPTALAELVLWAMARKREDRIPTIEAFIRELEPFATERAFRAQMTESDTPMPKIARSERFVDAIPVDDEVESIDAGPELSRPPPLRDGSASAARSRADEARVSAARAGLVAPPLTTLASRPALAKEVDTLGQRSSELAQSLRPAAPGAARRKTLGLVAVTLALVGATLAVWKFTDVASTAPSAAPAASVATPETPAPLTTLRSRAEEPRAAVAAQPAPAAQPEPQPAHQPPPTSRQQVVPASSAQQPAPAPTAGTPAAIPLRMARPLPTGSAAPKRPTPAPVVHRAGELNPEDL